MSEAGEPRSLDRGEIEQLAERLDSVLRWLTENADPDVRGAVAELLEGIQRVHGEGLKRLAHLLLEDESRWRRALADPVVSSLFELYELEVVPRDRAPPDSADDAGPRAEGPAGRAPVDPGGVSPTGDVSIVPEERLVQLQRRLARDDRAPREDDGTERIAEVPLDELAEGSLFASLVDDTPILVVRHGDGVSAYRNACPGSPLPLHVGTLEGTVLVCPWHGCRFDIRSGARTSGEGRPLDRLPSRVGRGHVRVRVP